jgi:hypothetical protein
MKGHSIGLNKKFSPASLHSSLPAAGREEWQKKSMVKVIFHIAIAIMPENM